MQLMRKKEMDSTCVHRPKKSLGQHFLKDETIANNIVNTLSTSGINNTVIEIGPGTGSLTQLLIKKNIKSDFKIPF